MTTFERLRLRRIDKYAPSANPYWFKLDELIETPIDSNGYIYRVLPALWLGRKSGRTTITAGFYHPFSHSNRDFESLSPREMVEAADVRYGGRWQYQWDGQRFKVEPSLNPASAEAKQKLGLLQELWGTLPNPLMPEGYDGPWYKTTVLEEY